MLMPALLTLLAAAPLDEVVATVEGRPILASQVRARQVETLKAGGVTDPRSLVTDLVNEALLANDGYAQKLEKDPAVLAAADAARRAVGATLHLEADVYSTVRVDEAQIAALFHETGDSVKFAQITLASEDEAKALLARLQQGADFAKEAVHSLDPRTAATGGDMGLMNRGQLEAALADAVFKARLKVPTGPVALDLGFAVVLVSDRHLGTEAELKARHEQIVAFATQQTRRALRQHYLDQLRKTGKAEVDEAFVRSTGNRVTATADEAAHVVARVGARALTWAEVLQGLVETFGGVQGSHTSGGTVKLEVARREVDRLLLEEAGARAGFDRRPEALAAGQRAEALALVKLVAARLRAGVSEPTAAEVQADVAAHQAQYSRPATRTCAHILSASQEDATRLKLRLEKGERFEELARTANRDTRAAASGGVIGEFSLEALEQLERAGEKALATALRQGPDGQVSAPVQSRDGWHLVRCGALVEHPPVLAEVGPVAAARLKAERGQAAVTARIAALRQKAHLTLDEAALARLAAPPKGTSP